MIRPQPSGGSSRSGSSASPSGLATLSARKARRPTAGNADLAQPAPAGPIDPHPPQRGERHASARAASDRRVAVAQPEPHRPVDPDDLGMRASKEWRFTASRADEGDPTDASSSAASAICSCRRAIPAPPGRDGPAPADRAAPRRGAPSPRRAAAPPRPEGGARRPRAGRRRAWPSVRPRRRRHRGWRLPPRPSPGPRLAARAADPRAAPHPARAARETPPRTGAPWSSARSRQPHSGIGPSGTFSISTGSSGSRSVRPTVSRFASAGSISTSRRRSKGTIASGRIRTGATFRSGNNTMAPPVAPRRSASTSGDAAGRICVPRGTSTSGAPSWYSVPNGIPSSTSGARPGRRA